MFQDVIVFGGMAFKKVIKLKMRLLVWTCGPRKRGDEDGHTENTVQGTKGGGPSENQGERPPGEAGLPTPAFRTFCNVSHPVYSTLLLQP